MDAVAGNFHRRAHRAFHVEVKAQAVAVTLQRPAPGRAHGNRDLSVVGAALDGIHLQHRRINPFGEANFPRIETVIGVKRRFDLAQLAEELFTEERRTVLGAEPFSVFTPQQAAIFRG